MHTRPLQMGIASLWRELAWDVKYNNNKKNLPTFICLRLFFLFFFPLFFCPHSLPVWTKYKSHRWYLFKRRCRRGLCLLQAKETRLFEYNSWKSGLCISQNCRVGESTFGGVTVGYCAFKNTHTRRAFFFKTNFIFEVCFDFTVLASY